MSKKKIIAINILTVLAILLAIRVVCILIPYGVVQQIVLIPFQIAYQYAFILIFAMNKTVLSKPLFNASEKPFKRYCIGKLLILLALEYAFSQLYSLYAIIAFALTPIPKGINETVYLVLIFAESIVDYLVLAKKEDSMKSSPKHLISALSLSAVVTAVSAVLYNAIYQTPDFTAESGNLSTYVNMLSYKSIADHIPEVLTFALSCVFIIFHTLSLKSEPMSEPEHMEEKFSE